MGFSDSLLQPDRTILTQAYAEPTREEAVRLFVAIAFTATLFVTGPAAAHFAKSLEASSPLQLVQNKDKGKKKKKEGKKKESVPKTAPKANEPAQRY